MNDVLFWWIFLCLFVKFGGFYPAAAVGDKDRGRIEEVGAWPEFCGAVVGVHGG